MKPDPIGSSPMGPDNAGTPKVQGGWNGTCEPDQRENLYDVHS